MTLQRPPARGESPACEATAAAAATFLQQAREQYALLKIGVLAMLVLACALPFSLNLVDPDLWGHVQYAQDWLAAGEMPRTATHTYTAEGYPWVNHENAAELAFAWGVEHLGIHWMLVLKCLLGLAIVAIVAATAKRHGVPALSAWALMVLVAAQLAGVLPDAAAVVQLRAVHGGAGVSGPRVRRLGGFEARALRMACCRCRSCSPRGSTRTAGSSRVWASSACICWGGW